MPNYNYVIDSTYKPYSLQEMLMPLEAYKEAYNQAEEKYLNLSKGASVFEYLSSTLPKDSEARQLYEKYANDLEVQARDFETNGLNISNGSALTSLRRRYDKEIGKLERADAVLKEIQKDIKEKGPSHLWENEMPTMDDILHNPNYINWGISGDELYNKGAIVGKNFSSRIYNAGDGGKTLGGYYRDFVERVGIDPSRLNDFQREMLLDGFAEEVSSIPELKEAALSILETTGAAEHLHGNTLNRALKQVVRGIVDNAVYSEKHSPQRDEGVMSSSAARQYELQEEQLNMTAAMYGLEKVGNTWVTRPEIQKGLDDGSLKRSSSGKIVTNIPSGGSSTDRRPQISKPIRINWNKATPLDTNGDADLRYVSTPIDQNDKKRPPKIVSFDQLPTFMRTTVENTIGKGNTGDYYYYVNDWSKSGGFLTPNAELVIEPMKIIVGNGSNSGNGGNGGNGGGNGDHEEESESENTSGGTFDPTAADAAVLK